VESEHVNKTELDRVMTLIESHFLAENSICHDTYCSFFNVIDLADKYWYEVAESHPNSQWTAKFLYAILKFLVIDVWVHYQQLEVVMWKSIRQKISEYLIANRM
jgi:hypothetical protein